jgi:hypothetical protein
MKRHPVIATFFFFYAFITALVLTPLKEIMPPFLWVITAISAPYMAICGIILLRRSKKLTPTKLVPPAILIALLFAGCASSGYYSNTQDIKQLTIGGGLFSGGIEVGRITIRNTSWRCPMKIDIGGYSYELEQGQRLDFQMKTILRSNQVSTFDITVTPAGSGTGLHGDKTTVSIYDTYGQYRSYSFRIEDTQGGIIIR